MKALTILFAVITLVILLTSCSCSSETKNTVYTGTLDSLTCEGSMLIKLHGKIVDQDTIPGLALIAFGLDAYSMDVQDSSISIYKYGDTVNKENLVLVAYLGFEKNKREAILQELEKSDIASAMNE